MRAGHRTRIKRRRADLVTVLSFGLGASASNVDGPTSSPGRTVLFSNRQAGLEQLAAQLIRIGSITQPCGAVNRTAGRIVSR